MVMKRIATLFFFLLIIFSWQRASAENTSTSVSADADVRSQFPTTNFGSGSHNYLFRTSSSGNIGRLFLKFPLPSIPAGSTITQAYIIFKTFADDCAGTPTAAYVAAAASDWSESSINWNNQPQPQNASTFIYPCEANGWVAAPALDIISGMIAGTRPNYGFVVYGSESGNWQRSIYSKEYDGHSNMAYMHLIYTPPAAPADNSGQTGQNSGTSSGTPAVSQSAPATSTQTVPSTTTQTTTSAIAKTAPAINTSTDVSAPANLKLDDVSTSDQALLKLTWGNSATADIDGYKIFRSEKADTDFLSIAATAKDTPTFTDSIESGKSYYYKVRAYKGEKESADSNIVSFVANITSNTVPEVKTTLKDKVINFLKSTKGKIMVGSGIVLVLLLAATLIVLIRKKKLSTKSQN